MTLHMKLRARLCRPRGIGMIEALVALGILAFGLLAMTRLQARALAASTEAQQRLTAQQLGDELLSSALVDTANAVCYTRPAPGTGCNSARALEQANAWATRVGTLLPGPGTATVSLAAPGRLTATLQWTGRQSQDTRTHVVSTDVR
jgi:type IV pilus assembly protein PilV